MKKLGLLPRLILGLIAGIILGKIGFVPLLRIMITFNGIFGNFLQFVIPINNHWIRSTRYWRFR